MGKAATEIQKKAKAFAAGMNKAIKAKRDKKIADLIKKSAKKGDEKGDAKGATKGATKGAAKGDEKGAKKSDENFEDKVIKVEFLVSKSGVTLDRTPEKQAETVAKGVSWTCASAHMVDKARHVPMYYTLVGKSRKYSQTAKEPWGSGDEHFMTYTEFSAEWTKQMKAQGVRNYVGGKAFHIGDAWHIEMPSGKLLHSDPAVKKCLVHYVDLTRAEGGKPNKAFEDSKFWKADLAPIIKAAEDKKAKEDEARRIEELKKMQFDGQTKDKQGLVKKVNKSTTKVGKAIADIDVLSPIDSGGATVKKVNAGGDVVWDSLARSIFEYLGLSETKGFDVKLVCSVVYNVVSYDNLTQKFITGLTPQCGVIYNTPAAMAMGMTVDVTSDLKLTKSGKAPKGSVTFNFVLTTPIDKEVGNITITIDGEKTKVTSKVT